MLLSIVDLTSFNMTLLSLRHWMNELLYYEDTVNIGLFYIKLIFS